VKGFKIEEAFPDIKSNPYHWRVDPYEPNRVWFTIRTTATHTGPLHFGMSTYKATSADAFLLYVLDCLNSACRYGRSGLIQRSCECGRRVTKTERQTAPRMALIAACCCGNLICEQQSRSRR